MKRSDDHRRLEGEQNIGRFLSLFSVIAIVKWYETKRQLFSHAKLFLLFLCCIWRQAETGWASKVSPIRESYTVTFYPDSGLQTIFSSWAVRGGVTFWKSFKSKAFVVLNGIFSLKERFLQFLVEAVHCPLMISSRTQCPVDNKIRAPKSTESKRVQDAINELIIWKLNSLVVVVMTSQFTRDIDYPRYEISTGSVFLNLIYCNVFIAILSIACMTGALWAKRGERDISRGARYEREARDEGKRKIKRLFAVHCSCCSAHLRPQILTTRGDVKRTNQNTIHYRAKIVTFLTRSVCIAVEMRSYDCFHGFANSYQSLWA